MLQTTQKQYRNNTESLLHATHKQYRIYAANNTESVEKQYRTYAANNTEAIQKQYRMHDASNTETVQSIQDLCRKKTMQKQRICGQFLDVMVNAFCPQKTITY